MAIVLHEGNVIYVNKIMHTPYISPTHFPHDKFKNNKIFITELLLTLWGMCEYE